jgi:guanine deaminase
MMDLAKIGQAQMQAGRTGFLKWESLAPLLLSVFVGKTGKAELFCRYGMGVQLIEMGDLPCNDTLFGTGGPWMGHSGEAYGLLSGLWFDNTGQRGFVYFTTENAPPPGGEDTGNFTDREKGLMKRALELGVNIGIGTDGVSSGDNGNMYEAMRLAAFTSHVQKPDPYEWATAEQVYRAGTIGSAKALGIEGIGAIAPGMKADIVFLDLHKTQWMPHNATINQMIHAEDATGVRHVMIGGRFVYRDGRHTMLDMAKLADEAEAARARLEAAALGAKGFAKF